MWTAGIPDVPALLDSWKGALARSKVQPGILPAFLTRAQQAPLPRAPVGKQHQGPSCPSHAPRDGQHVLTLLPRGQHTSCLRPPHPVALAYPTGVFQCKPMTTKPMSPAPRPRQGTAREAWLGLVTPSLPACLQSSHVCGT